MVWNVLKGVQSRVVIGRARDWGVQGTTSGCGMFGVGGVCLGVVVCERGWAHGVGWSATSGCGVECSKRGTT